MSLEGWMVDHLESASGHQRVYRQRLPQGVVLPALTYFRVDTVRLYAHDGDAQLPTARFQVDVWAEDLDALDTESREVVDHFSGLVDDPVQATFVDDDREFDYRTVDDRNVGKPRRIIDLLVTYRHDLAAEGS